ncbi:NAD-glutamate dehydrogenase [Tianweitania populi]|uniref:NAD-glutamate dehydrogenase n=1 Tax=Tianweitania populi TaxID=1607949 RepID=A0A8J3DY14_9HYPH|nr:NAD-glutamate dehydrogenase [Tianweitania populi]
MDSASRTSPQDPTGPSFAKRLFERAPAEDLARYDAATLEAAAAFAKAALRQHRRGQSVVAFDALAVPNSKTPLTAITVINDNMPFLFDSVVGEVAADTGEAVLVVHPIFDVRHGADDAYAEIVSGENGTETDRVSVIQIHTTQLSSADAELLKQRILSVLKQVKDAVTGWQPMLARLDQAIAGLREAPAQLAKPAVDEAVAFLEWLRDENFTFLGMRDFHYQGDAAEGGLERVDAPGLGILSDPDMRVLRRGSEPVVTTPEIRAFLHGPEPLLVTKANAKTSVHRRAYLDYIGVKTFGADGSLQGELRIVGLFTSTAYTRSVMTIPYLRSKAKTVIGELGFDPGDHSGKALINVLESYPRDELFQIEVPVLRDHAEAILALGERPRVRVLTRADQFDRFVAVLVFVPRDRYDSIVREKIAAYLKDIYRGRVSAYYPSFPEGGLARVHFIIGRSEGQTPTPSQAELEEAVRAIVRTWDDTLREAAIQAGPAPQALTVAARLPESYRESFSPVDALLDAERLAGLTADNGIAIDFYRREDQPDTALSLKIHHFAAPVPLSKRVPLLENMGFRVISERTFEIPYTQGDGADFIHDMELEPADGRALDLADAGLLFESVFLAVWNGQADNDGYNGLALTADLSAKDIVVLRAYGHYLQQAGIPQSQDFIAGVLNRSPSIARALLDLFQARLEAGDAAAETTSADAILQALDDVASLDDDTVLRRFLNLVQATLRTNHFAGDTPVGATLALKLDARAVTGLPEPRPWREIFVYGPEVEGVHLRFGPVARGGLRWSDRAQDYRTEVLGLVKAQQVKNAVIVPVGAKGGFFPKKLPTGGSRNAVFEAGTQAYVTFVSALLSITDNIIGDHVVAPVNVLRRDEDDPYFVVAADKGTATFSDTANAISQAHDFWLDDAFASGGSAGYDHKKMGITARGAWEAVKRHFREMNRDIQSEPFTVAGVGDMSGDVFGNGMLLSEQTQLVAAFDHRDIIIDPQPNIAASFAERKRLFDLPRSSWQDYDKSLLSKGGMIVPRNQKTITLSPEAAALLGLEKTSASPTEVMTAILKLPVDLLWFGGIGTYIRGSSENNADVGDRANDPIRITGGDVGAKVIGEGANLGVTQRARIEYGLRGGRCNSDAIDNSGGVNSSDLEVNIKIALASAMRSGRLTREDRNVFLAEMTGSVASLVLENNYRQTLALSLAERRGLVELPYQRRFITGLEERNLLDRAVEVLPSDVQLADRESRGVPLTRAELGVLLAYAKLTLFSDLVGSGLPDEPVFERDLIGYFPREMAEPYRDEILSHRLRREIIATEVANDIVDRGGPAFVSRLQDMTGASAAEVVHAYVLVRDGFELAALYAAVDALDTKIDGHAQLDLYAAIARLARHATTWQLRNGERDKPLAEQIVDLRATRTALETALPELLPDGMRDRLQERARGLAEQGVSPELADKLALLDVLHVIPEIMQVAARSGSTLPAAAKAFFAVTAFFRIGRIEDAIRNLNPTDYYEGLALTRAEDAVGAARRRIAAAVLQAEPTGETSPDDWVAKAGEPVLRARSRLEALTDSGELTVSKLTVASGILSDLAQG